MIDRIPIEGYCLTIHHETRMHGGHVTSGTDRGVATLRSGDYTVRAVDLEEQLARIRHDMISGKARPPEYRSHVCRHPLSDWMCREVVIDPTIQEHERRPARTPGYQFIDPVAGLNYRGWFYRIPQPIAKVPNATIREIYQATGDRITIATTDNRVFDPVSNTWR